MVDAENYEGRQRRGLLALLVVAVLVGAWIVLGDSKENGIDQVEVGSPGHSDERTVESVLVSDGEAEHREGVIDAGPTVEVEVMSNLTFRALVANSDNAQPIAGALVVVEFGEGRSISGATDEAGFVYLAVPEEIPSITVHGRSRDEEGRRDTMSLRGALALEVVPVFIEVHAHVRLFLSARALEFANEICAANSIPVSRARQRGECSISVPDNGRDPNLPIGLLEVPALAEFILFARGSSDAPFALVGGKVPPLAQGEERDIWLDVAPQFSRLVRLQVGLAEGTVPSGDLIADSMFTIWTLNPNGLALARQDIRGNPPFEIDLTVDPSKSSGLLITSRAYAPTEVHLDPDIWHGMDPIVVTCGLSESAVLVLEALTPQLERELTASSAASRIRGLDHWNPILLESRELGGIRILGLGERVEWARVGRHVFPVSLADGEKSRLIWPPPGLDEVKGQTTRVVFEGASGIREIWLDTLIGETVFSGGPVVLGDGVGGATETTVVLSLPRGHDTPEFRAVDLDSGSELTIGRTAYEGRNGNVLAIYIESM